VAWAMAWQHRPMSRTQTRLSGDRRRAMVQKIADRDGWFCWWCGIPLAMDENGIRLAATLDHLITRAAGGSNRFDNQVIACYPCNQDRGATPAEDYYPKIRYRVPETADNCVPLSYAARGRVGTLVSRGDAELHELELGRRVVGSIVHENATIQKNRIWRISQRAKAAIFAPREDPARPLDPPSRREFFVLSSHV
jgi:hypothetical protein